MLVLSRKAQQSIRIGDSVTVTILSVKGNSVRIGIEAPQDTRIVRAELPDFGTDQPLDCSQEAAAVPSENVAAAGHEAAQRPARQGNRIQRFVDGPKPPLESMLSKYPTLPALAEGTTSTSAISRPR